MKHNFLTTLLAFSISLLTLQSCESLYSNDDDYDSFTPGIDLYNRVSTTNYMATDAPEVALKLAFLLEQAALDGMTISDGDIENWSDMPDFTLPYNDSEFNLKYFLFNNDESTMISKDGDIYRIAYGYDSSYFIGGVGIDRHYRNGVYIIDTNGVQLSQSSSTTPWVITIDSTENIKFAQEDSDSATSEIQDMSCEIYYDSNGLIRYSSPNFKSKYSSYSYTSDWTTSGYFYYEGYQGDLALDNVIDLKLYHMIYTSEGTTITGNTLKYATGGINQSNSPLAYDLFNTLLTVMSGIEEVEVVGDYNTDYYTSNTFYISWSSGSITMYYNGLSYSY